MFSNKSNNQDEVNRLLHAVYISVWESNKNVIIFNIGSCDSQKGETYQEKPPFLSELSSKNLSYDIFNLDPGYKSNSGGNRYALALEDSMKSNFYNIIADAIGHNSKVIIFDNTQQGGLAFTHIFAKEAIKDIGKNLEIIIGYGMHGDQAIIPILHPNKDFYANSLTGQDAKKKITELENLYCNGAQTLYRPYERMDVVRENNLIAENESLTRENFRSSWGDFFISNSKAQTFLTKKAGEQGMEIYFSLEEFKNIPLFTNSAVELKKNQEQKKDDNEHIQDPRKFTG